MNNLLINKFNDCKLCGECCSTPCDLIPSDLPPLLSKFKVSLPDFFKKYLISLIIASPSYSNEILMMVPVRVDANGKRTTKYLADSEYLKTTGKCVFLKDNKCLIHEVKPYGGRYLLCAKMTSSVPIQLPKNQYYAYWDNNQHIFETVFPEYRYIFSKLKAIYEEMNKKTIKYESLRIERNSLILGQLFPLFNQEPAINGYQVLTS